MISINKKFQMAAKELFAQNRSLNAQVAKVVQEAQLSSMFSSTLITSAAAYEFAIKNLTFTESFIDNELDDLVEFEIVTMLEELLDEFNELLLSKISIKMTPSDIQDIIGLKILINLFRKVL